MDVLVTTEMAASPQQVAQIMFHPSRDPEWIGGAKSVEAPSGDPTALGARTRRHGGFLGKKFSWVTEVMEYERDTLLRMKFVDGPMKGEVSYRIEPLGHGSRVSVRNSGGASFTMPGMSWMLRRSVARDLERLKSLVEG